MCIGTAQTPPGTKDKDAACLQIPCRYPSLPFPLSSLHGVCCIMPVVMQCDIQEEVKKLGHVFPYIIMLVGDSAV